MDETRKIRDHFEALLAEEHVDEARMVLESSLDGALEKRDTRAATFLVCSAVSPMVSLGESAWALACIDRVRMDPDTTLARGELGRVLAARASVLRSMRRFREALDANTAALESLEGLAPDVALTTLRHDRAVLMAELGEVEEAITVLVDARRSFLAERDRVGVAASDHNLSFLLHDLGMFDDAIEYLTEARDIFLAIDMPEEAAGCDQNLGVVLYDLDRLAESGRRFAVAHHRFTEADATISAAECDANLATLLEAMGHDDEAGRYRERAEAAGVGRPLAPGASQQVPVVSLETDPTGVVDHGPVHTTSA